MAISHAFTNAQSNATGTLTYWGGATTATVAATDVVRPQDWNSAHVMVQNLSGNTLGTSQVTGADVVWAGGNNVTLSANGSTVTISAANQTVQTQNMVSVLGSTGNISFANSNGITIGGNASTITLSHNGLTQQSTQPVAASAGNGSVAFSTLSFSNANGISFSTAAGPAIVASHNGLTSQSNQAFSASGGSSAFQTLNFANSNGATFTNTNGSVALSYTVPTVTQYISATNTTFNGTNVSGSITHNTAGLRIDLSVSPPTSAGMSNGGNTSGNTGFVTGQLALAGGNNITLSGSTNGGSMTITISGGAGGGGVTPVASASNGSFSFTTLAFSNANNVTFGTSAGSIITASVAAPGAAAENNWFNFSGNTSGNTTASGSTINLSAINLTLSGTNGSQIAISAPATSSLVGSSGLSISTNGSTISVYNVAESYKANLPYMLNTQTFTVAQSTSIVWPMDFQNAESVGFVQMPQTVTMTSMASLATTANTTITSGQTHTYHMGIYTRGTGASSQSLQSTATTTFSSGQSFALGANANGSNYTVSHGFSFPMSTGQSTFSTSYGVALTNFQVSTTHLTAFTGAKKLNFVWNTVFQPERMWFAFGVSTALATQASASFSNAGRINSSGLGLSQVNLTFADFGQANNASVQAQLGIGSFTTNAIGTRESIPFANISSSGSHIAPYITLARIA